MEKLSLKVWPDGSQGCQTVLDGEYDIEDLEFDSPPVILDIGANIGSFAVWAAARWPGASLFCYEPNPVAYAALKENAPADAVLRKVAVSDCDGKAPLFVGMTNLGAASLKRTTGETGDKAGIVRLVHAMHLPECDVLKIDTEGSEVEILLNYPHLDKCRAVMLEWHSTGDRDFIAKLLSSRGLSLVSDNAWSLERGVQKWVRKSFPHLYVAILAGGGKTWAEHEACMEQLRRVLPANGINVTVAHDLGTGVDRARNRQCAEALKDESVTHVMFIDDDVTFDAQWVLNMVRTDFDVVGAAYPRKEIDWKMVESAVKMGIGADYLKEYSTTYILNCVVDNNGGNNAIHFEGVGDFVQVEELGTGFLMFKRSVLERMIAVYGRDMAYVTDYPPRGAIHYTFFECQRDPACVREKLEAELKATALAYWAGDYDVNALEDVAKRYADAVKDPETLGRYLTEDYAFCRLWRMLGGKIYVYIDATPEHWGFFKFSGQLRHALKKVEIQSESNA